MTVQGWWILAGLIVGGLNVLAFGLLAKYEDERPPLPSRQDVSHVRIVHKDVA